MIFKQIRDNTPCLPNGWINFTRNYALLIVIVFLCLTGGVLTYTLTHFKINTDLTDMVSNKLPFRKTYKDYQAAFPHSFNNIVIVIDADTPEAAQNFRKLLAKSLISHKEIFESVYLPGGGAFFEKNGLLYLSLEELEDLTDKLSEFQPFLAILSRDFSLRGLFSILEKLIGQSEEVVKGNHRMLALLDRISAVFEGVHKNRSSVLSWQGMITGENVQNLRQFIIVKAVLDYRALYPGKTAINLIRHLADELQLNVKNRVNVRLTGDVVLNHEDLMSVQNGIGLAVIASFILVGIVLYFGLKSIRHVMASLLTLLTGLIWTLGFAIAFLGSLNMISITFAVLFIGISVDYSIQYCLHYREFIESGADHQDAVGRSAKGVCNAFILCTVTTAIGFYAFVPTAYAGASELGIISGTGMFINLFINLTLLPALLNLTPLKTTNKLPFPIGNSVSQLSDRFAGTIIFGTVILAIGAIVFMPQVSFDYNPLNLSNPAAESVITAKELFNNGKTSPWTISIIAENQKEAKKLSKRLEAIEAVDMALTIGDFVPTDQDEKLEMIADIALFFPPISKEALQPPPGFAQEVHALGSFETALKKSMLSIQGENGPYAATITRLHDNIQRFNLILENPVKGQKSLQIIEDALLTNLSILMDDLKQLLQPGFVTVSDLPRALRQHFISSNDLYRIQVFPKANIADIDNLKSFVSAVRMIAPDATAAPITILESGRAIVSAFRGASLGALVVISIFLMAIFGQVLEVILVLLPLLLAIVLTSAASVLLDIPFNFANIIVVPLLLGIGVDYSIHLVYRFRSESSPDRGILKTSTSRGVLFSALTTIASFGSLSFLSHRGTASMGILLTLCICFMIVCCLLVLPAFLNLLKQQDPQP
ncbi:MMPL family transporter [Thermodesulfobacteriota bacterium]